MTRRRKIVSKLRASMSEKKLGALLVTSGCNVHYLTGFTGSDSIVILTRHQQVLLTDFRYVEQGQKECPDWEVVEHPDVPWTEWMAKFLTKHRLKRLAFEADYMSWHQYRRLSEAAPKAQLEPTVGLVEELRVTKAAWEVDGIRRALRAAESAFDQLRSRIVPGVSEKELADELEVLLRREGASQSSFDTIVAFGARSSLPHARSGATRLKKNSTVLVDWGARLDWYNSDLTRVLVAGRVTSKFEKLYRVVADAQKAGIEAVGPGVEAAQVDAAARDVIRKAGYAQRFGHGLGHGVGLEVHEAPALRSRSEVNLMPGMVITIEPGIYIPGWGGIRIEDMVLVTHTGHEVLSSLDKGLESVTIC